MLSRVADSLYWMSRYIERSENLTRLMEVNLQLMLDFESLDDERIKAHWEPIIRSTGDEELFYKLYDQADSETVTDFMTFSEKNPNSVLCCVMAARENARMVRDQISTEMWEVINKLYLFLRSNSSKQVWKHGAHEFYERIKEFSHTFSGLVDATIMHDEGYNFVQLGTFIERADKTTRILDIKYHILLPAASEVGGAVDTAQWVAVLRSASAYDAFHRIYVGDVNPAKIADFLIFSSEFPRSIRYCVNQIDRYLHRISNTSVGGFSNEPEKACGRLVSDLTYSSIDDVFRQGLHEYLDGVQLALNEIGGSTFDTYMFLPPIDLAEEIHQQQLQQQQ